MLHAARASAALPPEQVHTGELLEKSFVVTHFW